MTDQSFFPILIEIAQKAGQKILEFYNDESTFERVDFKSDDSPLTLADSAAHLIILEGLKKEFPDIPVLSEEGREIIFEKRESWEKFWLVDPLDGTKEFIKRNGEFTVNIALIEKQESTIGVLHVPVSGVTYFGGKGLGAFKIEGSEGEKSIEAKSFTKAQSGIRMVVSRSHLRPEVEEFIQQFDSPRSVSMGSSLKFMLLAEGKADIYPRLGPTMEWDTGAAQAILEAAGGKIIDHETGEALRYNKENLRNPYFIAYGKMIE